MKVPALRILTERLVEGGFLLETRPILTTRVGRETGVEVGNTGPLEGVQGLIENSASHYLECIRQNRLSWLLFDGSIVQLNYRIRGDSVAQHRYCYIPSPFDLDLRGNLEGVFGDVVEGAASSNPLNTSRRAALRFEFDQEAAGVDHPAAHVHLNVPSCRIPMRGPLSVAEFLFFLIGFFYSDVFAVQLCGEVGFDSEPTITNLEETKFHLNWRRSVVGAAQ